MNGWFFVWWGVAAALCLSCFIALVKGGRPVRTALSASAGGWLSLLAVNLSGTFTGVSLGINTATLFFSTVLGAPGVVLLLVLKTVTLS